MSEGNPYEAPEQSVSDPGTKEAKQWAMFLHLSQLANALIPPAGLIAPIVIWQLKKADFPALDEHGKMVANWMISAFIYSVGAVLICLTVIGLVVGVPVLIAVGIALVAYPIIGGIKANNGEFWPYPLTIRFLK